MLADTKKKHILGLKKLDHVEISVICFQCEK